MKITSTEERRKSLTALYIDGECGYDDVSVNRKKSRFGDDR